ncbi:MAG: LapA family protein [Nitrospinota bacterium]
MGALRLIVALAVVVVVVMFGVKNMDSVDLSYYWGVVKLPLFFALLIAFVLGFLCAWLLSIRERIMAKGEARMSRAQVKELERELEGLKEQAAAPPSPEEAAPAAEEPSWSFREEGGETEEPRPSP